MQLSLASIVVVAASSIASAQTFPIPARASRHAPFEAVPQASSGMPSTSGAGGQAPGPYQVVDLLSHHDDFWSNLLVSNCDHDRYQEFVEHVVPPVGPGPGFVVFFEDDGAFDFSPVASLSLDDGGVLAIGDIDGDGLADLFGERAIGVCQHEFVRWEASSPFGFPDHVVWTDVKEGNMVDMNGTIADVDGDGLLEFITTDNNFSCSPTTLKVFEPAPGNQMVRTANLPIGLFLGNPVAADFDADGAGEILVADGGLGNLVRLEAQGNDQYAFVASIPHTLYNSYQLALLDRWAPDGRPMAFLAGQFYAQDYRVQSFECVPPGGPIALVQDNLVPANCGASIPQIWAADLFGSRRSEIVVSRLCDPLPIYTVGAGGALSTFQTQQITEAIGVAATTRVPGRRGAIAVPTAVSIYLYDGLTRVLAWP